MHTLSWAMSHSGTSTVDLSLPSADADPSAVAAASQPMPNPGSPAAASVQASEEDGRLARVLAAIEQRVNELIREARPVLVHTITRAQYDAADCPFKACPLCFDVVLHSVLEWGMLMCPSV